MEQKPAALWYSCCKLTISFLLSNLGICYLVLGWSFSIPSAVPEKWKKKKKRHLCNRESKSLKLTFLHKTCFQTSLHFGK